MSLHREFVARKLLGDLSEVLDMLEEKNSVTVRTEYLDEFKFEQGSNNPLAFVVVIEGESTISYGVRIGSSSRCISFNSLITAMDARTVDKFWSRSYKSYSEMVSEASHHLLLYLDESLEIARRLLEGRNKIIDQLGR